MMANVCHFDYDKKKLEWFILDSKDGDEDVRLFNNEEEINMEEDYRTNKIKICLH